MMTTKLLTLILSAAALTSCGTTRRELPTTSLRDAVIAAAKEARAAGASKLTYEASVTTTISGEVSVVIPVGAIAPSFGASVERSSGSTVTIEVDIPTTATKKASGEKYLLDTSTFRARRTE